MTAMKSRNIFIIITILSIHTTIFSQGKNTFEIETQGGYEYNYFKSPDQIRVNDTILSKDDLIESSIYQDIAANYKYRNKWSNNRIRVYISPFSRIFYQNFEDSYWSLDARAKYDYKFSKELIFLAEVRFKRMNREGLGGDQDVLINPLGYTNYGATTGIGFVPFENNKMELQGFYNFKNFDAFGVRDLEFDEFGIQFSSVHSFESGRLEHKFGFDAYAKKRLYDTFNASDIDTDDERDWDYVKGILFYELPFSENFKIRPNFAYYARIDNSTNGRSGFSQYGPGITMSYRGKTTKVRSSFSFITRNYKEIEARDIEGPIGDKLKYEYANFQLNASHEIGNGFSLTGTIYSRIRSTNYTDIDARSFRNYRNQYAGVGVQWKL